MFASRLQNDTKDIHSEVEKHPFVQNLLQDELETTSYYQHLKDLQFIYQTLEAAFPRALNLVPSLKKINFSELAREQYIVKDLNSIDFEHLHVKPSMAAIEYVNHLFQIQHQNPLKLLAHVYVRYLGDLSGGFILKKHIEKKWPNATNFYDFSSLLRMSDLSSPWKYKKLFKQILNELPLESHHYRGSQDGF